MQHLEQLEAQVATKWTAIAEARAREGTLICQVADTNSILREKTWEHGRWQTLWAEPPRTKDGSRCCSIYYGNVLKKCGLETLKVKAKRLFEELNIWLKTMLD
eukprot:TRINITY_DN7681_c0_g1_i1.p1 TRINITY_DN7681_c0_g1~~TRINITY_DN7681_c0_g1_i1.p1  ORF type:complete len:103 (+),score=19.08 TRINITY_DN7681_c0_g1_i1:487-795(+)